MAGRPQHQPDRLFARSEPPARSGACPKSRAFHRARAPAHAGNGNRPRANVALLRWETRSALPASELLNLKNCPKSYKSLILNIIFAILTVILLAGAGYFIYTRVLPKTDTTLEEKPAEVLKHEAADLPPGQEAPVKYAPDDIKGPKGLQVARDALKRKVEPDTAMALAQQLFAAADDVKAQDGAFLIADELAKKGNAQALLMLGDFYSPKQPQRGTIQKDTDMANDCYKKALAAGAAEAQQRLDALK